MATLFDAYLAVDWSSRNTPSPKRPSADALWVAELLPGRSKESYIRTRCECVEYLRSRLREHVRNGLRVCIGFDFPYGYPRGYAAALGLRGPKPPWRLVWDEMARVVTDHDDNTNNRFEVAAALNTRVGGKGCGPLWGCPASLRLTGLTPTSPEFPFRASRGQLLERMREVDRLEKQIQPAWKLAYRASVGSQILVGLPAVRNLRDDPELASVSKVWPFETGFTPTPTPTRGPAVLHVEIWPSAIPFRPASHHEIKDQAQVRGVVTWLREHDAAGTLGSLFARPTHLSTEAEKTCVEEEGWIIGARVPAPAVAHRV